MQVLSPYPPSSDRSKNHTIRDGAAFSGFNSTADHNTATAISILYVTDFIIIITISPWQSSAGPMSYGDLYLPKNGGWLWTMLHRRSVQVPRVPVSFAWDLLLNVDIQLVYIMLSVLTNIILFLCPGSRTRLFNYTYLNLIRDFPMQVQLLVRIQQTFIVLLLLIVLQNRDGG